MKIKTKLQLIIIVNILILAGIISLSLLWQKQTYRLSDQGNMITKLNLAIFERSRLREEYFLYGSDRSKEQFLLIHKKIGGHLERISGTFTDPEEQASLNNMNGAHQKIGDFFNRLARLDESATVHTAETQALRERIISQMLVNAHAMYQDGVNLLKEANEKTAYQNNLAHLISNIVFGLLALIIGAFALIIIRNITSPLKRLHEGTVIISGGDLDYRTNISTSDEIGQLSNAFDLMTEELKKITVSRDLLCKEIEIRKQAEEAVRESESRYRELFNNMSSGVAIYEAREDGADFVFKDFNRAGERIDGDKREDLIGKSIFEARPGIKEFGLLDVFKRVWGTGIPEHFPVTLYKDARLSQWYENFVYKLPSGEIVAVFDNVTGDKLAKEMMEIRSDIPVILCSGYDEPLSGDKVSKLGIKAYVTKPFIKHDLARVVRRALAHN